jgi:hypothetical protein
MYTIVIAGYILPTVVSINVYRDEKSYATYVKLADGIQNINQL